MPGFVQTKRNDGLTDLEDTDPQSKVKQSCLRNGQGFIYAAQELFEPKT